ncbi:MULTISPECIES: hypothetical protein [Streptomyces]|uniref:hypothetical protein n=1 Tax=Streptomyces TaxID=1883 RepID=UPI0016754BCF|nr:MULTISPECIES: hypothetical protein [Streptomyces]MBK3523915.1 hypothetical protein [Streptomyces sp. MBT70]
MSSGSISISSSTKTETVARAVCRINAPVPRPISARIGTTSAELTIASAAPGWSIE